MQATLTLTGDFAELQTILAKLNGTAGVITMSADKMPVGNIANASDEDDTPNASAPALDTNGLPHDERIHASTKAVTKEGAWKRKRGVDDATVAAVESELRQKVAASPAPTPAISASSVMPTVPPMPGMTAAAPATPAVPATPSLPPMPQGDNAPAQVTAPTAAMPMPTNPEPAPDAPFVMPTDFNSFMLVVQAGMQSQKITTDYLTALVQEINAAYAPHNIAIGGIVDLSRQHPSMIEYAVKLMQRDGKVPA